MILSEIDTQKLDLFGSEYIAMHFLKWKEREHYKNYIADALKALTENTAKAYGGTVLKFSFNEMKEARYAPREREKSVEEVVESLKRKLCKI